MELVEYTWDSGTDVWSFSRRFTGINGHASFGCQTWYSLSKLCYDLLNSKSAKLMTNSSSQRNTSSTWTRIRKFHSIGKTIIDLRARLLTIRSANGHKDKVRLLSATPHRFEIDRPFLRRDTGYSIGLQSLTYSLHAIPCVSEHRFDNSRSQHHIRCRTHKSCIRFEWDKGHLGSFRVRVWGRGDGDGRHPACNGWCCYQRW